MTRNNRSTRKRPAYILRAFFALALSLGALTATAQTVNPDARIALPQRTLTRQQAIEIIRTETSHKVLYNPRTLNEGESVNFGKSEQSLATVLDKLTEGTGQGYSFDGDFVIIHKAAAPAASQVVVIADRRVTGTVTDSAGEPLEGVSVEMTDSAAKSAVTFINGRFRIEGVPSGSHIVKLTSADGRKIRYREVTVRASGDTDVTLIFNDELLSATAAQTQATGSIAPAPVKTTAYFVPNDTDHTIRAFSDEPRSEYSFVPSSKLNEGLYMPKAAIKTNLLWLATASPNLAVEFGLANKWTLDISAVYNPFQLQKGGVNRFGLVQPEVRYWFCQRFEKHFIGLHGIYGRFNIGQVDFLTRTFETHRYKGWGAGGGVSYGYHLPMSKRWSWEFTAGVGYVYLEYDNRDSRSCRLYKY